MRRFVEGRFQISTDRVERLRFGGRRRALVRRHESSRCCNGDAGADIQQEWCPREFIAAARDRCAEG